MHGGKDFQAMECERRNRQHQDFPSTITSASGASAVRPATITERVHDGVSELWELHAKLNEILDRLQGPRIPCDKSTTPIDEPGLRGGVEKFRRLTVELNGTAEAILLHL